MLGFGSTILILLAIVFNLNKSSLFPLQTSKTASAIPYTQFSTISNTNTWTPEPSRTPFPSKTLTETITPTLLAKTVYPSESATHEIPPTHESITDENLARLVSEVVPWQFNSVADLAYSPDGEILAIADYGNIMLYKGSKYERINIPAYASQVGFSPDGKLLITYEAGSIKFREVSTLKLTNVCKIDPSEIKRLAIFPNNNWVAATGYYLEPYIAICNYTSEIPILYLGGVEPFTSLAVSNDGESLAAGAEKSILLWNNFSTVQNQQPGELLKYSLFPVSSIAFSQDGEQLISGGINGEIITWSLLNLEPNLTKILGSGSDIQNLGIIPGSNMTFSISKNNVPFFLDLTSLEKVHELTILNTDTFFTTLAVSPNSESLAIADENGAVYIIHLPKP